MSHTAKRLAFVFPILAALLLVGCDSDKKAVDQGIAMATNQLQTLKTALDTGQLRNGVLLKEYARLLVQDRPELATIANNLADEATSNGRLYQRLVTRLDSTKDLQSQYGNPRKLLPEVDAIITASKLSVFDQALADPVNVLADMSNGRLARVGAMSKADEAVINDAENFGPGSQLVGNPAYGHWSQGSNGMSFWEWYGMYSLFSNLMGGHSIFYDRWDRYRPYSYYQDVGVDRYGTYNQRSKYASTYRKSAAAPDSKSYSGVAKRSSFSKGSGITARSRASSFSTSSSSTPKASSFSRGSGSLRNSGTYSRGISGGK